MIWNIKYFLGGIRGKTTLKFKNYLSWQEVGEQLLSLPLLLSVNLHAGVVDLGKPFLIKKIDVHTYGETKVAFEFELLEHGRCCLQCDVGNDGDEERQGDKQDQGESLVVVEPE